MDDVDRKTDGTFWSSRQSVLQVVHSFTKQYHDDWTLDHTTTSGVPALTCDGQAKIASLASLISSQLSSLSSTILAIACSPPPTFLAAATSGQSANSFRVQHEAAPAAPAESSSTGALVGDDRTSLFRTSTSIRFWNRHTFQNLTLNRLRRHMLNEIMKSV